MININGRQWNELMADDVEKAIEDNDESFFFEYKEDAVQPKKLVEEISAFANTYGGYIFVHNRLLNEKTVETVCLLTRKAR